MLELRIWYPCTLSHPNIQAANETHSSKGMYLRDVLEGEGLAGKYFIDTEINFKPAFSIHTARIEKANRYCLGTMGGRAPKLLQLINPDNRTPAALPSSICL